MSASGQRKQRIGIVALAGPENGGVYQYAQAAIDALASLQTESRSEFEFVVFTSQEGVEARGLERQSISFSRRSIATQLKMGAAVLAGRGLPQFVPAADRKRFESVDAFFIPSVLPYPQLYFDKPYIATIHDLQERHFPEFFSAAELFQRAATNRTVARRARRIICESAFVQKDIETFLYINKERIDVVPAPPPLEALGPRPDHAQVAEARARHGLKRDYLFYPAAAWPHKNHLALVRAFARVRKAHPSLSLVFSGGKQTATAAIEEETRALGIAEDVVHLGYLPYPDLRAIFRGARALVVPTLFESISIPVYEAFALGVPVCLSEVVGLPEQAGDAAVLFDPTEPGEIAKAIERVLGDPALAQTLIARGEARLAALQSAPYGERLLSVFRRAFL